MMKNQFNGKAFSPIKILGETVQKVHGEFRIPVSSQETKLFIGLTFYSGGFVRYRIEHENEERWQFPFAHYDKFEILEPTIEISQGAIVITSEHCVVTILTTPYCMRIFNNEGKLILEEYPNDVNARSEWVSFPTGLISNQGKDQSTRLNFSYGQNTSYYGTGERFSSLRQNNRRITLWNDNPYGSGTDHAYKNIPFVLTDSGYGLLLHETAPSIWDFGCASNYSFSIETEQPGLELCIVLGNSMQEILTKYSMLTAKAPMPPRWSFGVWVSPFGNYLDAGSSWQQKEFLEFIDSIETKQMPCDVIHLDPYWMGKTKKLCDFVWDTEDFPNPKAFIDNLKQRGLRLCLWEHPYIEKGSDLYKEGARKGYFIKNSDGSVYDYNIVIVPAERRKKEQTEYAEDFYALGSAVDFSNPAAVEWYKSLHRPLIEMGTATFKTDFGEVTPYDAHYYNGQTGREMHNIYAYLYNKSVWEVQQEYVDTPFLWGRSGYAGSQAFPVQWSGDPVSDLRSLRTTIISGLNYGMSGVPFWSFDIGGFKGLPDSITYIRWAQVGLLLSHARFHGTASRMPWDFSPEAEVIVMEAVRMRYRILPYLYATAKIASETGIPVIRALPLAFEHDYGARAIETEFMLGDSLLVVPVLEESGEVEIYIPSGTWFNYHNDEIIRGPITYKVKCALDMLPIFVMEGAIIPMADDALRTNLWDERLIVHIYGFGNNTLNFCEEAKKKSTIISSSCTTGVLNITIDSEARDWEFVCHGWNKAPEKVLVNEKELLDYRYKADDCTLQISIQDIGTCQLAIKEV